MMKCESISPNNDLERSIEHQLFGGMVDVQVFKEFWDRWQKRLTAWAENRSEPKVYQRRDRQGHIHYQVYDPQNGTSAKFGSESEVLAWIEQRYYR